MAWPTDGTTCNYQGDRGKTMKTVGTTQFVSISEAKASLPKLVDSAVSTVVLRHNEPVAAVLPIDKYNDYMALERLVRDTARMNRLREQAREAHETPIDELATMADLERRYDTLTKK
jgi:prevent-host-death family protein